MLLRSIVLLALLFEVAARGGRGRDDPNTETMRECGDGQDNDGDGTADCDDPDCATAPPCMAGGGRGGRGGCAPCPWPLSIGAALTRAAPRLSPSGIASLPRSWGGRCASARPQPATVDRH